MARLLGILVFLTYITDVLAGEICAATEYYYSDYYDDSYDYYKYCNEGCCGYYYDRECCGSISGTIAGAVVGAVFFIVVCVIIIICIKKCNTKRTGVMIATGHTGPSNNINIVNNQAAFAQPQPVYQPQPAYYGGAQPHGGQPYPPPPPAYPPPPMNAPGQPMYH